MFINNDCAIRLVHTQTQHTTLHTHTVSSFTPLSQISLRARLLSRALAPCSHLVKCVHSAWHVHPRHCRGPAPHISASPLDSNRTPLATYSARHGTPGSAGQRTPLGCRLRPSASSVLAKPCGSAPATAGTGVSRPPRARAHTHLSSAVQVADAAPPPSPAHPIPSVAFHQVVCPCAGGTQEPLRMRLAVVVAGLAAQLPLARAGVDAYLRSTRARRCGAGFPL